MKKRFYLEGSGIFPDNPTPSSGHMGSLNGLFEKEHYVNRMRWPSVTKP